MTSELWNTFHDGSIVGIDGSVPGDIHLHVFISYMRDQFPGKGDGFLVNLISCSHFDYEQYDQPALGDLAAIAALEPEILSADPGDPIKINCITGILALQYQSAAVFLDSGAPVTLDELKTASDNYWGAWPQSARADS